VQAGKYEAKAEVSGTKTVIHINAFILIFYFSNDDDLSQHEISAEHIRSVLRTTRPSVSVEERVRLDRMCVLFISFCCTESDRLCCSSDIATLCRTVVAGWRSHRRRAGLAIGCRLCSWTVYF
jgi:hypothetical protein